MPCSSISFAEGLAHLVGVVGQVLGGEDVLGVLADARPEVPVVVVQEAPDLAGGEVEHPRVAAVPLGDRDDLLEAPRQRRLLLDEALLAQQRPRWPGLDASGTPKALSWKSLLELQAGALAAGVGALERVADRVAPGEPVVRRQPEGLLDPARLAAEGDQDVADAQPDAGGDGVRRGLPALEAQQDLGALGREAHQARDRLGHRELVVPAVVLGRGAGQATPWRCRPRPARTRR